MAVFDAQVPTCLGSYGWSKIDFRNFFQKHTPRPEITQKVEKLGQKTLEAILRAFWPIFRFYHFFKVGPLETKIVISRGPYLELRCIFLIDL